MCPVKGDREEEEVTQGSLVCWFSSLGDETRKLQFMGSVVGKRTIPVCVTSHISTHFTNILRVRTLGNSSKSSGTLIVNR